MSLDIQELKQIKSSYATASAGMHPSHTLPSKLRAISEASFKWTEIALLDLEKYASSIFNGYKELDSSGTGDIGKLLDAAKDIRNFATNQVSVSSLSCRSRNLKATVTLQESNRV